MTVTGRLLPLLDLVIEAGPVTLRSVTDELLAPLAQLAVDGIHDPAEMPFYFPWSTAPADLLPINMAQYHWRTRATFSPTAWSMQLAVFWDGELVGCQGLDTVNYLVTRTGETGSWLGRRFQGQGIGTAMRQAICAFAFDDLDAAQITSGAFTDNPKSLAVSRKVGYEDNGTRRVERRPGEVATVQELLLTPATFVRGAPISASGAEAFRESIGLPDKS